MIYVQKNAALILVPSARRYGISNSLFRQQLSDQVDEKKPSERKYVYGIKGLATLMGCSTATAQRIKSSGAIDGAIIQRNRRIIVDSEKALKLYDDPFSRWGLRGKTKLK